MDSSVLKESCVRLGTHWRNLANTIEPFVCGGDAALQSNHFDHTHLLGPTSLLRYCFRFSEVYAVAYTFLILPSLAE